MKKLWALVLAGCIAVVLSTTAWAAEASITTEATVDNEAELIDALNGPSFTSIRLGCDIEVSSTLVVDRSGVGVTLDLNGHVLRLKEGSSGSVIKVEKGTLTLVDNSRDVEHKFTDNNGLWTLDETNGTETVEGGVITGGMGGTYTYGSTYNDCGGGVFVAPGASFVMNSGNIVGCRGDKEYGDGGGGVFVSNGGEFTMTGGTISGCVANRGGGLCNHGTATLSGTAKIESCRATGTGGDNHGGGVCSFRKLTVSGNVEITGCAAAKDESAAMYVDADTSSIAGGTFDGSVMFDRNGNGSISVSEGTFNGKVTFNNKGGNGSVSVYGGTFSDKVTFNSYSDNGSISVYGGTFNDSVTFNKNNSGSISVSGGTFNGDVTFNNDDSSDTLTVSGGTFNGAVGGAWAVTFNTQGGSTTPRRQIRVNAPATKPSDPTKDGFDFGGWYTDAECTTEYKFTEPVTKNLILYAKWTNEPVAEQPKYYYKASGSGETTEAKGSPKTFDAGVGVYVGMAVLGVSGSAVVLGKKRK